MDNLDDLVEDYDVVPVDGAYEGGQEPKVHLP